MVLFGGDAADKVEDRVVVGEHADSVDASFDCLVHLFEQVRGPDLSQVVAREGGVGGDDVLGVREHGGCRK